MIPTSLEGWTIETLMRLVSSGVFELESFDFKAQLPHTKADKDKKGLVIDCAAFANSNGGYLVFGVKDDRNLAPEARLIGIDSDVDFPARFGNFPSQCSPHVQWRPKPQGIPLSSGKIVQVVEIPKSWKAPHSVEMASDVHKFPRRTNKGTEYMPINDVQAMFLGLNEKRRKLDMLSAELKFLAEVVKSIDPANVESGETTTVVPPIEVLQALVGETYILLDQQPGLMDSLTRIRSLALKFKEANDSYERGWVYATSNPMASFDRIAAENRNHNALLRRHCEWMRSAISDAQQLLGKLIS